MAILGVSGSGKSTLLSLLAGLDTASAGEIYLLGQALSQLDEDKRAALRLGQVGFIFQAFHLIPSLTALENIMLPLELAGNQQAESQASNWLTRVGLAQRGHHYPHQLSGGEQQRVAIARAFAITPKILFADEPTGNLDSSNSQHIIKLLQTVNREQNTTLVLVTHDEALAAICQHKWLLKDGQLHAIN
ncbi:MAG: transporter [Gammaproteobacteria bacterium]|nr:transporter [Gammaproteobacteria bacterium]